MDKRFISENLYKKIVTLLPICCVDLVVKMANSFLLAKRLDTPYKGIWFFPGGRIFFGESFEAAIKRKLKEELNIRNFRKIKFLGAENLKFQRGRFGKPGQTKVNVFLVKISKGDGSRLRLDKTHSEWRWFDAIRKDFHPYLKKFLTLAGFKQK